MFNIFYVFLKLKKFSGLFIPQIFCTILCIYSHHVHSLYLVHVGRERYIHRVHGGMGGVHPGYTGGGGRGTYNTGLNGGGRKTYNTGYMGGGRGTYSVHEGGTYRVHEEGYIQGTCGREGRI